MTEVGRGGKIRRVPNQPKTPVHGFRIPDELYAEAKRFADKAGESVSDVVRRCLTQYVRQQKRRERQAKPE